MPPKPPRTTLSGKVDKRSSSSHANAQKARDILIGYIQRGKAQSAEVESEEDPDLSDNEADISDVEPDPMAQSQTFKVSPPTPTIQPVSTPEEPRKPTQLESDMAEMKEFMLNMTQPKPPPVSQPIPVVQAPLTYYERQMKASSDKNKLLEDAFNKQWM